jgi:hypothetical protein
LPKAQNLVVTALATQQKATLDSDEAARPWFTTLAQFAQTEPDVNTAEPRRLSIRPCRTLRDYRPHLPDTPFIVGNGKASVSRLEQLQQGNRQVNSVGFLTLCISIGDEAKDIEAGSQPSAPATWVRPKASFPAAARRRVFSRTGGL